MADNALTRMSLGGQVGASLALAAVIGGAFWYFYWSPTTEERDQKAAKLEALQKEIRALEVTAQKLGDFQREVALLERKLETLKSILPPAKETPDLMRKVQALAAQSNLGIINFTPSATVNREFYQEWPITMGVNGSYHNLAMFFDRVSRLPRLVNVGNLNIRAQGTQTVSNTIGVSFIATTFVYIEDAPPPPGAPGAPRPAGAQ
jgi:type IV pilus assembly protein PilO